MMSRLPYVSFVHSIRSLLYTCSSLVIFPSRFGMKLQNRWGGFGLYLVISPSFSFYFVRLITESSVSSGWL